MTGCCAKAATCMRPSRRSRCLRKATSRPSRTSCSSTNSRPSCDEAADRLTIMTENNLLQPLHASTKRNYVQRVIEHDKAESATVARLWGRDYWDGDRRYGYGGYRYDGRWRPLAQTLIDRYVIKPGMSVLDVGCGKGYLLYEFTQLVPDLTVAGIDISDYGIANAKAEVRPHLQVGGAVELTYAGDS